MTKIHDMPFGIWIIAIAIFVIFFAVINRYAEYAIIPSFITFTMILFAYGYKIDPFFKTGINIEIRLIAAFFLGSALILQAHFFDVFFGLVKAVLATAYYAGNLLGTALHRL